MYCIYGDNSWYIHCSPLYGVGPQLGGVLSEVPLIIVEYFWVKSSVQDLNVTSMNVVMRHY